MAELATVARPYAEAAFELDVTTLGVKPPRILIFKVENIVRVEVKLTADSS